MLDVKNEEYVKGRCEFWALENTEKDNKRPDKDKYDKKEDEEMLKGPEKRKQKISAYHLYTV